MALGINWMNCLVRYLQIIDAHSFKIQLMIRVAEQHIACQEHTEKTRDLTNRMPWKILYILHQSNCLTQTPREKKIESQ